MRLDELKGYKDIADKVATDWVPKYKSKAGDINAKYFERLGLKQIGGGSYGETWDFGNPNWVLKIFEKDDGYKNWIAYSLKNRNNPYCPRFKGKLIPLKFGLTGVIIERLGIVSRQEYQTFDLKVSIINILLKMKEEGETDIQEFLKHSQLLLVDVKRSLPSTVNSRDNAEVIKFIIDHYETIIKDHNLIDAIKHINQFSVYDIGEHGFANDLSIGNVMSRNGHIVITDPLG